MSQFLAALFVADSLHRAPAASSGDSMLGVYIALASLFLTVAVVIARVAFMAGQQTAFKNEALQRLSAIETAMEAGDASRITREELNARFGEVRAQLSAVSDRMSDSVRIMTEALKR